MTRKVLFWADIRACMATVCQVMLSCQNWSKESPLHCATSQNVYDVILTSIAPRCGVFSNAKPVSFFQLLSFYTRLSSLSFQKKNWTLFLWKFSCCNTHWYLRWTLRKSIWNRQVILVITVKLSFRNLLTLIHLYSWNWTTYY